MATTKQVELMRGILFAFENGYSELEKSLTAELGLISPGLSKLPLSAETLVKIAKAYWGINYLSQTNKIAAIKEYRTLTGTDLMTSKNFVEGLFG